ncbi:hypothetical protein [Bacteroides sp. AN502(2024)]|uniref:hypothetical protein n=1 Tax=Bacteroides sp. AN502(2024) TaxID=3160599 RepID=UPI0035128E66
MVKNTQVHMRWAWHIRPVGVTSVPFTIRQFQAWLRVGNVAKSQRCFGVASGCFRLFKPLAPITCPHGSFH